MRLDIQLVGLKRCPHCGVARPTIVKLYKTDNVVKSQQTGIAAHWGLYYCTTCGGGIAAKGDPTDRTSNPKVIAIYPSPKVADQAIPDLARSYLQQAYETLHAPDAAVMLAASCVDALLKERGYVDGNLFPRINKAVEDHILTADMGEWAHEVRLGSNRPRHADQNRPNATHAEAQQSVEFAEALAHFLFVIPARTQKGIEKAREASEQNDTSES